MSQTNDTKNTLTLIRGNLRFIERTLQTGYVDLDTADELCKTAVETRRMLEEYDCNLNAQPIEAVAA